MKKLALLLLLSVAAPALAIDDATEALYRSVVQGDLIKVQDLVDNQQADLNFASPTRNNMTPLELAAYNGQVDIAKYLLRNGAEKGQAAMWAEHRNHFALADFIKNYKSESKLK